MPGDTDALRLAHNKFSDLSADEFQKWLGLKKDLADEDDIVSLPMHSNGRLRKNTPNEVNWATTRNP